MAVNFNPQAAIDYLKPYGDATRGEHVGQTILACRIVADALRAGMQTPLPEAVGTDSDAIFKKPVQEFHANTIGLINDLRDENKALKAQVAAMDEIVRAAEKWHDTPLGQTPGLIACLNELSRSIEAKRAAQTTKIEAKVSPEQAQAFIRDFKLIADTPAGVDKGNTLREGADSVAEVQGDRGTTGSAAARNVEGPAAFRSPPPREIRLGCGTLLKNLPPTTLLWAIRMPHEPVECDQWRPRADGRIDTSTLGPCDPSIVFSSRTAAKAHIARMGMDAPAPAEGRS